MLAPATRSNGAATVSPVAVAPLAAGCPKGKRMCTELFQQVSMVCRGACPYPQALTLPSPRVNRDDHRAGLAVHPRLAIQRAGVTSAIRGHIAQRAGRASASFVLPCLTDVRAIGVIMVDVAGGDVVPNGTLVTTSVLLVSNPGWANIRVAWITSMTGNLRRSTKIRATSR